MVETRKTVAYKGLSRAASELQNLSNIASTFMPQDDIEGQIQVALDQITVSIDRGDFLPTGIVVGTRERVIRLEANPKVIDITPRNFLERVEGFLDDFPDARVPMTTLRDKISRWLASHPEIN